VTNEERECIRKAARRYVREQAPTPSIAVLERVARILLQARVTNSAVTKAERTAKHAQNPNGPEAA
jgi:hypothetical protein